MKTFLAALFLATTTVFSQQVSWFNQGFLRQQNAAQDLAWLGISNNPSGSGSVTNFTASGFSPLFTSAVTSPTTYPHLSFNPIGQSANLVYASPDGLVGLPSFRALTLADLPTLPTGGSVTNFSIGDLSPLFTGSVATPTFYPQVTFALTVQNNNKFLAGPNGGGPLAPTFRSIATADLPDITSIVRGDVSATAPVLYDFTTGVFSMHVADVSHDGYLSSVDWGTFNSKQSSLTIGNLSDAGTDGITVGSGTGAVIGSGTTLSQHVADSTHNGYLSSTDWGTFNGKGSGTLTSITNASFGVAPTVTMLSSSNPPAPAIKSISAGGNVTLTDNGTNIVIAAANSASGASGIDQTMTYISPYSGTTNFNLDFTYPAQTLNTPTNLIVFNYSTNWGLANTSRVANIFIQWTNYGRLVYFVGPTTNWHFARPVWFIPTGYGARFEAQVFGPGETNVNFAGFVDGSPSGSNTTASFNPTNIGQVKLWLDASRAVYQDELTNVPAVDGSQVRAWNDVSGFTTGVSNRTSAAMTIFYHQPSSGPYNVPSVEFTPGVSWMQGPTISAVVQPTWGFIMYYGRGGGGALDAATGTRFSCNPVEGGNTSGSFFCGSGLSYTGPIPVGWQLFSYLGNGNTSIVRTNGAVIVSGIAGAGQPTSWLVGTDNTKGNAISDFYIAEILVMNTNLTAAQLTNVESYFYRKYPFWTPPTVQ